MLPMSTTHANLVNSARLAMRAPTLRTLLPLIAFAVTYAASYIYGNRLPAPAPLWPPDAVLLSALLLTTPRQWGSLVLTVIFIRLMPSLAPTIPFTLLLLYLVGDLLKAFIAVLLLRHFGEGVPTFDRLRNVGMYVACAAVAAPVLSAFIGATGRLALGRAYWPSWVVWFLGDALASLLITPALLLWVPQLRSFTRASLPARHVVIEASALAVGLVLLSSVIFLGRTSVDSYALPQMYLLMPLLLWAAVRFGPRGISAALVCVALLAITGATMGNGPFVDNTTSMHVVALQVYLAVTAVPLLVLAAVISERKQAGEALRASEALYRTAFESATTGMMLVDLAGHSLQANDPLVTMLGYSAEELRASTFTDFTYPDDLDANVDLLRQALTGKTDRYQIEKRFIHKQGHLVWGLVSAGLVRDDADKPLYFVGQVQDITERKQAEQELRASEEQFRTMADTAPVLIWVADPDGQVTFVNAPWLHFTGHDFVQELGDGWSRGVHPDDLSHCLSTYLAALRARQDFAMEYRLRRCDGEYRWLLDSGVPRFASDGAFLGYIGSATDITEYRQAEEQLARLSAELMRAQEEERQRIASELHDSTVQTIVAAKLSLAILRRRRGHARSDGVEVTRALEECEGLMEQAATELRTLSYLLHPPLLDEAGLAAALTWYVEGFARRSGLRIELEIPNDLRDLPKHLEIPLYRVVQEALSNVYRHSGSKSARIVLKRRARALLVRIHDRGRGLVNAMAEGRGVGRGSALDISTTAPSTLGVGIVGMRQRLRQLGGRLDIHSTTRGTTITAVVPLAQETGHDRISGGEGSDDKAGTR